MAKQAYKSRKGARFNDEDAEVIGAELDRIRFDGRAESFVSAARPVSSPLHDYFEWDNDTAAELHRVEQARYYLRHIEIVIVSGKEELQTRAWHQVVIERDEISERRYVPSVEIAANEELEQQVIAKALREMEGWRRRYAEYKHVFGDIFAAIERTRRSRRRIPA